MKIIGAPALLAIGATGGVSFVNAQVQDNTPPPVEAKLDEVCDITGPIAEELKRLPQNPSLEDYEGAIQFALSQSTCGTPALIAALEAMTQNASLPALERQAIANAIAALRRGGTARGTGAIGGFGGDGGFSGSGFTPLIIGVGGGSSNYSN